MSRRLLGIFFVFFDCAFIAQWKTPTPKMYNIPNFTQPLFYLNPALTGASELTRIGVNYRNQWPGLDQNFNSYSALH